VSRLSLVVLVSLVELAISLYSDVLRYEVTYGVGGFDQAITGKSNVPIINRLKTGDFISSDSYLTTGDTAYGEIKINKSLVLRIGSNSILDFNSPAIYKLVNGTILFCLQDSSSISLSSTNGSAEITGPCTFIAESTSNGGYKFISLSGKPIVKTGYGESVIPAGRLVLVLGETNALGNAYDIDLLLLLKSSLLINAFQEPPPTMRKIGLAVYSQQLRLKNKYNALIGDAPTDKNLQMWVLGSSQNKKAE
jgi:hypothetical protein